jgi:hypothetical protein
MTRDEIKRAIIEGVTGPEQQAAIERAELRGLGSMFDVDTLASDIAYVCGCTVTPWYEETFLFRLDPVGGIERFEEELRRLGLLR